MKQIITIFTTLVFALPLLASSASTNASTGSGDGGLLDAVVDQKTQDDIKGKVQEQTGSLLRGFLGIKEPKPPVNETGPVDGAIHFAGDKAEGQYYYTDRSAPDKVAGLCVRGSLKDEFNSGLKVTDAGVKKYKSAEVKVWVVLDDKGDPKMVTNLSSEQKEAFRKEKCSGVYEGRAQLTKAVVAVAEKDETLVASDTSAAKGDVKTDTKAAVAADTKATPDAAKVAVASSAVAKSGRKSDPVKDVPTTSGKDAEAQSKGPELSSAAAGEDTSVEVERAAKPEASMDPAFPTPVTASTSSEGKAVTSVQAPKQAAALSPVPVVSSKAAAAVKPGTREIDPRADDEDAVVEAVKAASPANPAIAMTGEAAEKPPAGEAPTNEHLVDTQFIARVFKHGGSVFGVITARGDFPAMKMANCVRFDKIIGKNGTPLATEEITDGLQVTGYLIGDPSKPDEFIMQPQESTDARIQADAVSSGKCKGTVYPGFSSFAGQDVNVVRATGR